jgi:hypothetical protein
MAADDRSPAPDPVFLRCKRALQSFQSDRFNRTYSDLKQNPEFADIAAFFFTRLYGPADFSFRDVSIKKLHRILDGKVYGGMLTAVALVIELHELSDSLDDRMTALMLADGRGPALSMVRYQDLYRRLANYDQRIYQIDLSCRAVRHFHRLSRKWVVGLSLKTVRATAHLIGAGEIMDFVYEGYEAFRKIKAIDFFTETIDRREKAWHDEIWFGDTEGEPGKIG